ncbi:MAG: hypothetical protein JEZ14_00070 [Marinilabiliaceae bacterium]|nr:hypothetical protein [Marinilabiliaceae bacterium]
MNENKIVTIIADHRERSSGIPQGLVESGVFTEVKTLISGDYLINNLIIVERKTKDDFSLSLIQQRLFKQCANMMKTIYRPLFIIEGNPYKTIHDVNRDSIKGALLSIAVTWNIPVVYSSGSSDTVNLLIQIAVHDLRSKVNYIRPGYKPKTFVKQNLYFLQGIPSVGPQLAHKLLHSFGSVHRVLSATSDELQNISGVGKARALKIRAFLSG